MAGDKRFGPFSEDSVRASFGQPMRKILGVKQSPLNPLQWNVSLDCGHDVWMTRRSKPSRKTLRCEKCKP